MSQKDSNGRGRRTAFTLATAAGGAVAAAMLGMGTAHADVTPPTDDGFQVLFGAPGTAGLLASQTATDVTDDANLTATNAGDAYGYAVFDVDPGVRPGDTTITMKYFAIPAVSNEAGSAHDGTTMLPTTPFETFVFGRGISHGHHPGNRGGRTLEGSRAG